MKIRFRQLGLYRKTVWFIVALLGALWTLGERSANAASVVISEPQLEGELSPSEKTQLRSALESALKSQQLAPIAQTDLEATLSGEAQLQGCHTELCYERLGRLLDPAVGVFWTGEEVCSREYGPAHLARVAGLDDERAARA